ncbi:DegT/DnrJ/EryC1/StrS family aminotransferase [Phocaeicola coprocola]|jgi:dTDP-4-amino-4,6-dideoxygalactose transaminase|uniref:DegT/DnrJ/EryC1/StrS family aminotransferase n=1 Tax=Phocaeicola coprocola TaxID=310298 RepID=UPI00195CFC32|nr:DegT/DnrJ/EryC1/StrS family aminotransferase [Phocaeicola coprocola]MBM6713045.1 DegT/DnrJ/EryC1/StrS family aminotransferase [Phocaeicola coprocola]
MSTKNIFVTMPTLAPLDEVKPMLESIWDSGIMTHNGPLVQRFEKEVGEYLNISNVVSCVNGTIALQMAIRALELKGEIITTPFTFIATANSILWENCTPVFADIDPETFNIDPTKIEDKITYHTVGIMPVHVFGNACDIDAIDAIAKKHNLKVIYDAAHAVGVKYHGKCIFEYGDISTTSFHATKMLNTAEGGACFTTNPELDAKLRRIRFFGFENHADIVEDGTNAKMTEVHAAIGLANIKYLTIALNDRKIKYMHYKEQLSQNPTLTFQKIIEDCNYSYFPVVFKDETDLLKVLKELNAQNIFPRRYFYPSINTFNRLFPYVNMPQSEDIASRILCLPLYYTLEMATIDKIVTIILNTLENK